MPKRFVPRAGPVARVAVTLGFLFAQAWPLASAQERDPPPPATDVDVQAFFDGARLDQELADQKSPLLQPAPADTAEAASADSTPAAGRSSDSAPSEFDSPLEVAPEATGRLGVEIERSWVPQNPVVLVLGGVAVVGLAALVLMLALRELRREAAQRKVTFRRRSRRPTLGASTDPAPSTEP